MVEILKQLDEYNPEPLKQVYISRVKRNKRTLGVGVPTTQDLCIQNLFKLVVEPVTETYADKSSYAFRPNRTPHNALGELIEIIRNPHEKLVEYIKFFKTGIESFCNSISHR